MPDVEGEHVEAFLSGAETAKGTVRVTFLLNLFDELRRR
jgi:hypothetical protein